MIVATARRKSTAETPTAEAAPKEGKKRRSSAEIAERHSTVISLRAQGRSWATIEKETGLGQRQCRKIWKAFVDEGKLDVQQTDPVAVVFEQITRLDRDIETLADIGINGDNDNARVGALRAKAQLMAQQTELLQAVGLMPKNLGKIQVEVEQRYVIQQLMVFIDEFVAPDRMDEAEAKLLRLFRTETAPIAAITAAAAQSN